MEKFIVTTDSGCDLSASFCASRGIIPLHMGYTLNGMSVFDTMEQADLKAFYDGMRKGNVPKTSQATPYGYYKFWKPLLQRGLPVLHISLGSSISGTYSSGVQMAKLITEENPGADVRVLDSTLASVGYGMLCIMAADMRDSGADIAECESYLNDIKYKINTYYTTGDLTYLYQSGRVSKTGMVVAHALNIWPILRLDRDGNLLVTAKERGKKRTIASIHNKIKELCIEPTHQTLYICHSDIEDEAKSFGEEIKHVFGFRDVFYTYIGTTIGSNCGPGLMAAFFVGEERTK